MGEILYDDFEDGTIDKWTVTSNHPNNFAEVLPANPSIGFATKFCHVNCERLHPGSGGLITVLSNSDVGNAKLFKCKFRWANVYSGGGRLFICKTAGVETFYTFDFNNDRLYKVINNVWTLLTSGVSWPENVTQDIEFYQEADGNVVLKRNGIIITQIIDNEVPGGTEIGMLIFNGADFWLDDVYVNGAVSSRRKKVIQMRQLRK